MLLIDATPLRNVRVLDKATPPPPASLRNVGTVRRSRSRPQTQPGLTSRYAFKPQTAERFRQIISPVFMSLLCHNKLKSRTLTGHSALPLKQYVLIISVYYDYDLGHTTSAMLVSIVM